MKARSKAQPGQRRNYDPPSLRDEGTMMAQTLGFSPIPPKETADLMGWDPEER